jgi:hypothetical protein
MPDHGAPSWASVLAQLEDSVTDVERGFTDGERPAPLLPWSAPLEMGQLPEEFRTRAATLLERQAAAAELLDVRLANLQRQRQVTRRLFPPSPRPAAVYVDRAL